MGLVMLLHFLTDFFFLQPFSLAGKVVTNLQTEQDSGKKLAHIPRLINPRNLSV